MTMSVRSALAKLHNRDVRQRRRAVRHLFEMNDPEALSGFIKLLEDNDPWFREKAKEAVIRWAGSKDLDLFQMLAESEEKEQRLLAARVANRANRSGMEILSHLSEDEEGIVRLAAWESKMSFEPSFINIALDSQDKAVRKAAAHRMALRDEVPLELLKKILNDETESVRSSGIALLYTQSEHLDSGHLDEDLLRFVDQSDYSTKSRVAGLFVKRALVSKEISEIVIELTREQHPEFITHFSRQLRDSDWSLIEGMEASLTTIASDNLCVRVIRGDRSLAATRVRNSILENEEKNIDLRARIIEDLIGRPVVESTLSIISKLQHSDDELLSNAAINLMEEIS